MKLVTSLSLIGTVTALVAASEPAVFMVDGRWPGYLCSKVKNPIVVGGDYDAQWKALPAIVLADVKNYFLQVQLPWKGPLDLSAEAKLAYDDENLYLAVKVTDDVFTQTGTGGSAWNGDSLQFSISDDGKNNYWEFALALCQDQPTLVCHHAGSGTDVQQVGRQVKYKVRRPTSATVLYEAAVPWRCLPPLNSVAEEFRFSFIVNEADNGPRKAWMEWCIHSGIGEIKDPGRFGFVRLTKDKVTADAPLKGQLNLERNVLTDDDELKATLALSAGKPVDGTLTFSVRKDQTLVADENRPVKVTDIESTQTFLWKTGEIPGGSYTILAVLKGAAGQPLGQWQKAFEKIHRKDMEQTAAEFQADAAQLAKLLDECKTRNIPAPYQTAVLTLANHFAPWVHFDLTLKDRPYNPLPDHGPLPEPQKIVGPVKALFWNRARENAEYVRDQVKLAIEQAKNLLAQPETALVVPPVDLKTLRHENGVFRDKAGPILFLGSLYSSANVKDHLKMTADYGFAWWGIGVGGYPPESKGFNIPVDQWHTLTPYHRWDPGLGYRTVDEMYRRAEELNVAVYSWYPWWSRPPGMTGEKHDPGCRAGCMIDLDDPAQTKAFGDYLRFIAKGAAPYRHLFLSFMLENETAYNFCSCSHGLRTFKAAMAEKYGSIDRLNARWGTTYNRFNELTVPTGRLGNKGHWYDYNVHHQTKLPRWLTWLARETKRACPSVPVQGKTLNGLLDCWDYCVAGMDREQVGDVTDYWEIDGYCWYGPSGTEKTFAFSPWQELGADDLHRSLKTAPILETEYHCIPWDYWGKVNPDHIKACFWAPAVHGVDGFMIWIWQRPGYNGCNANGIDEHADRLHAYSTASLDLRRLAKYVTAIPTQSGQVAILVSNASLINQDNQWNTLMDAYRGLFWLNTPPTDFITERQIARGKLAQYKVLVVHNSPYLPEETFQSIQEFARQGGTVVVTLDAGRSDPYGKPLPVTALTGVSVRDLDTPFKSAALDLAAEEIFADRQPILTAATREKRVSPTTARILGRHAGVPVLTVNPLGKGRVYYLGVDLTMDGWTRFFDRVFVAAKVQTGHLRLADDRNQPITGVEHREATVDGKRVVYLMNMLTQPSRVALPKPAGAGWFDLIRNRPLNTPALTADPLVPHLLMDR